MQPYFAPYLGYFQLIKEVDTFVFYDDVNFIKGGWINRNYFTINEEVKRLTIPLKKSSSFKLIKDVEVDWESKEMTKLIKTFTQNFKKKPIGLNIIEKIIESKPKTIADMSILSVELACKHLDIDVNLKRSSTLEYEKHDDKVLNLVEICKLNGFDNYVNPEGGQSIYTKEEFSKYGIKLEFIKGMGSPSILEIIDDEGTKEKLKQYECI